MGKGYAFEMVNEMMQFAFREYKLIKLLAITLPFNTSSIRLLQKLGMKQEGQYFKLETNETLLKYSISI
jgi:RimJ/RimL family protein N-acetyltransferase